MSLVAALEDLRPEVAAFHHEHNDPFEYHYPRDGMSGGQMATRRAT